MNQNFLSELANISTKFHVEDRQTFNIFNALHNIYDERRLHSRFIANLLSPESSHGKKDLFLKPFIDELGITDFNTKAASVIPDESNKSEYEKIDIYIRSGQQAIIIENKIFAKDSNDEKLGDAVTPQLLRYFHKIKSVLNLSNEDARKNIHLIYLNLHAKKPSYYEKFEEQGLEVKLIDYSQFIYRWLDQCRESIPNTQEDTYLKDSIIQYKKALTRVVNNISLALALKSLVSDYIDASWGFLNADSTSLLARQLKHIKWHTVAEFWAELGLRLESKFGVDIALPGIGRITRTTHNNIKTRLAIGFIKDKKNFYIANDMKGFTYGDYILDGKPNWYKFRFDHAESIKFSNFGVRETFKMINTAYRQEVIDKIVNEFAVKYELSLAHTETND